jgi:hypothetical protein
VPAWIGIRGANRFSREDVCRDGLGLALNAHRSLDVIWLLEGVGFLRKAAYEPDSAGRLRLRRDVNPAVIGVSLAETAETPRRLAAVANVSAPVLIGVTLAEIAEIPSPAPSGDQCFAHQGFAGSSNDRNTRGSGDGCLRGALALGAPIASKQLI